MHHSVKLPKSFVAIDLSEKEAFERRSNSNGSNQKKESPETENAERGRSEERRAQTLAAGNADVPPVTELPSPVMNGGMPQ